MTGTVGRDAAHRRTGPLAAVKSVPAGFGPEAGSQVSGRSGAGAPTRARLVAGRAGTAAGFGGRPVRVRPNRGNTGERYMTAMSWHG